MKNYLPQNLFLLDMAEDDPYLQEQVNSTQKTAKYQYDVI